jgi:hypothetical protein
MGLLGRLDRCDGCGTRLTTQKYVLGWLFTRTLCPRCFARER